MTSDAASPAVPRVAAQRVEADRLGHRLAELTEDPEAFVGTLEAGLTHLADPGRVARRGTGPAGGSQADAVPAQSLGAIERPVRAALREGSSSSALWLAARLERSPLRPARRLARACLERAMPEDPERAWQSLRRTARSADGPREVDALAGIWAEGILAEDFRWAELEQLVYSERSAERRLVGATLARLTRRLAHRRPGGGRRPSGRALSLLGMLMGDADPDVQVALARAIREWAAMDPDAVEAFLRDQTAIAREHRDGHRAWVIRRALAGRGSAGAADIRGRLSAVRRTRGAPATSIAARQAQAFSAGLARTDAALASQGERFARTRA